MDSVSSMAWHGGRGKAAANAQIICSGFFLLPFLCRHYIILMVSSVGTRSEKTATIDQDGREKVQRKDTRMYSHSANYIIVWSAAIAQ